MEASSHIQNAGRNTLDKLVVHSARGIMNTFSLSNIEIQIRPYGTYHGYFTFCQERKICEFLANFHIYSEIRNNPINAESTTGSNKF